MAAVVHRRDQWMIDYKDAAGVRRWLRVGHDKAEAEATLERMRAAGMLWAGRRLPPTHKDAAIDRDIKTRAPYPVAGVEKQPKHGLSALRKNINKLAERGLNPIDETTEVGQALTQWRGALIQDLGGEDALSTQQRYIVELVTRLRLMLDSIDAWLLAQPTLVNKQRRQLFPVVKERTSLADSVVKHLETLGLKRQARNVTLHDVLAKGKP